MALSTHVPDLAALEVLLGVARSGSLNSAARQIGISQQAVSARIRAMEAQTGVTLVRRTPRGSSLTDEGAVIAEWAARVLDVAAGMDAGIAALRADRRSRLRVSSSSTIAEQLLPGWLASFRAAAAERPGGDIPDVVLTAANTETVINHVRAGSADLGFIEGPRKPTGLRATVIGRDRLIVVVASGHPWTRRRRGVTAAGLPPLPSSQVIITTVDPLWYSWLLRIGGRLVASHRSPSAIVPSCMSWIRLGVMKENAGRLYVARSLASRG